MTDRAERRHRVLVVARTTRDALLVRTLRRGMHITGDDHPRRCTGAEHAGGVFAWADDEVGAQFGVTAPAADLSQQTADVRFTSAAMLRSPAC